MPLAMLREQLAVACFIQFMLLVLVGSAFAGVLNVAAALNNLVLSSASPLIKRVVPYTYHSTRAKRNSMELASIN